MKPREITVETKQKYVLALDLGTTGNRAIIFDKNGEVVGQSYGELTQYYPHPGWLEHDPMEICMIPVAVWNRCLEALACLLKKLLLQG